MSVVIDFHTHVFRNPLRQWTDRADSLAATKKVSDYFKQFRNQVRTQARTWSRPITDQAHELQTVLRYLPRMARDPLDFVSGIAVLPGLLIESTSEDLLQAMDEAQVNYGVTIAHPPTIANDFIMDLARQNSRFLPVVNIPKGTPKPGGLLKKYVQQGAKAVKIHAASEGEGVKSPRYRAILRAADELGIPVILHTGCIHLPYLYKDPEQGHAEQFTEWFETFKNVRFVLSHMNFHDPNTAFDLCEEFPQLYVDTSWQPAEAIGEAVRRIGADRVLFASDWPLVGNNIRIARQRVRDCLECGLLNQEQSRLILGENAAQLLGIQFDAP